MFFLQIFCYWGEKGEIKEGTQKKRTTTMRLETEIVVCFVGQLNKVSSLCSVRLFFSFSGCVVDMIIYSEKKKEILKIDAKTLNLYLYVVGLMPLYVWMFDIFFFHSLLSLFYFFQCFCCCCCCCCERNMFG